MTILNATTQGAKAYIITDKAWCQDDGTVAAIASKFIVGTAFPFLIAPTGNANPFDLLSRLQQAEPRNGRQLIEAFPTALRDLCAAPGGESLDAGFMVAIWDKRKGRPMIYLIATSETHFPGAGEPFEPYWIESMIGGTVPAEEALGRPVDLSNPHSFDPFKDGADLVEVQRRRHRFEHFKTPAYRIGGGVEVGVLTRKGVKLHSVREWPEDKVGELIAPRAFNISAPEAA